MWNSLQRMVLACSTPFARFLRSLKSRKPLEDGGTATPLWPMPMPFPRWTTRNGGKFVDYKEMCLEKALNIQIVLLSWLHLGKPSVAPASMALERALNFKQWAVVKRFKKQMLELADAGDFGPSNIGRSVAKVESLAFLLDELRQRTAHLLSPYEHRPFAQSNPEQKLLRGHELSDPGEVIGTLAQGAPQLAKCVEPSRLSFPKEAPTFDATEFFDEPHRSVFLDPIANSKNAEDVLEEPPRVHVHASKQQALELFRFLDRHHRLRLVPEEKIRTHCLCGAFSLIKNETKDRLILDARPPNLYEDTLNTWSKTLGAISALLQIELLPEHKLVMSGTDLQDYYYCFRVTQARAVRNTFNHPLKQHQVKEFNCYNKSFEKHAVLYPCLATMAMGDCQAVELGQKCHVKLGLNIGALKSHELLCVHGRAPRGKFACGIIIDDLLLLEQVPMSLDDDSLKTTECAHRLHMMLEEYTRKGLSSHPDKTFEASLHAEIWGGSVDGITGLVRAAPRRLIPLMDITICTAQLGVATVGLLQMLAGAWVSIFQYRKRMMVLLDEIYVAQQCRDQNAIVRLSAATVDELWSLIVLGPLAVGDLRARTLGCLHLTDASESFKASVSSDISEVFARELNRHTLCRGAWTKLLSPWKVWLQQHYMLEEDEVLPEGVPLISHPLWCELAQVLQFQTKHRQRVVGRRHINILELEAVIELEHKLSLQHQDVRYLCGSDSQVTLACLLKGRSSSPRLNAVLSKGLATCLGAGLYGGYGYVPSLLNAGDDPTRLTDVRRPAKPMPDWMCAAMGGQFEGMDKWLAELGYDPLRLAQLPFAAEYELDKEKLRESFLPELRRIQKPERLARFDVQNAQDGSFCEDFLHEGGLAETGDLSELALKGMLEETVGVGRKQKQEEERPQENFEERPDHFVASNCESDGYRSSCARARARGGCIDDLRNDAEEAEPPSLAIRKDPELPVQNSSVGFEYKGQEELESQTKTEKEDPPGKMNRGHNHSVACKDEPPSKKKKNGKNKKYTGSLEPPPHGRALSAMAENPLAALLSADAMQILDRVPRDWFFKPGGKRVRRGEVFVPNRRGFLDLYSGRAAVARSLAKRFNVWVICIDYDHGEDRDLLNEDVQKLVFELIQGGCLLGVGAAPECCSFSRAVNPAVRSALHPEGLSGISQNMFEKVQIGNRHAKFVLQVLVLCRSLELAYWVENPDGSFLWLLRSWRQRGFGGAESAFRFDMCRYRTPWRKRTRILTNTLLSGRRELCLRDHSHVPLKGRNKFAKMSWTRYAQTYPRLLAYDLATAMAQKSGILRSRTKLNIGGCARCCSGKLCCRIGEADHPGPRRAQHVARDVQQLLGVELVEPTTKALQHKVWRAFQSWLRLHLSEETVDQLSLCPALLVVVLQSYGAYLFSKGSALYEFRHLLVLAQQLYPWARQQMNPAWALVSKWELLQPVKHRQPLHAVLFKAMMSLALMRRWYRWAATLLLGFEGIARISEVLTAFRADLVLPSDQFDVPGCAAFLRVSNPKTKRRGRGKVQHLKLKDPVSIAFLEFIFGNLDASLMLFPASSANFRTKWELLLDELLVPRVQRPTPASIRGGGAILAYQRGENIQDLMWRMRVTSQRTLEHYLQELAADTIMTKLPSDSKTRIRSAALIFPLLIEHRGNPTHV
eukprot:Skav214254  [mRNA]  locus=scaffold2045:416029:421014:- [translate_table: standard]